MTSTNGKNTYFSVLLKLMAIVIVVIQIELFNSSIHLYAFAEIYGRTILLNEIFIENENSIVHLSKLHDGIKIVRLYILLCLRLCLVVKVVEIPIISFICG